MAGPVFVGREVELGVLEQVLAHAAGGEPSVAVVRGEAGMGKSALVRRFLSGLPDETRVLQCSGDEAEIHLDFGVADHLLRVAGSPMPVEATVPAPTALGTRLLGVITEPGDGTTVVVVDDAQWVDQPSLRALAFALRRLRRGDRCLCLIAVRAASIATVPESLLKAAADADGMIHLSGLDVDGIRALVHGQGRSVPADAVARLRDLTRGSPLHARALLDELDDAQLAGPGPLPAPSAFHALVLHRVAACAPATEALLAAAAVLGERARVDQVVGLAGIIGDEALDEAVGAGLLQSTPGDGHVAFVHPLVQAAVYHDLAPSRRAALHQRAASIVDGGHASTRHTLAGVLTTDDEVADASASWAHGEASRGSHAAAAFALLGASRITSDRAQRERRHLEGTLEHVAASQYEAAATAFAETAAFERTALLSAIEGVLAFLSGRQAESVDLYAEAWRLALADTSSRDTGVVGRNLGAAYNARMRCADAIEVLLPAAEVAPDTPNLLNDAGVAMAQTGRVLEGLGIVESHPALLEPSGVACRGRGVLRYVARLIEGAIDDLRVAELVSRRSGPAHRWHEDLTYLAMAEFGGNDWEAALSHATLVVSFAGEPGSTIVGACASCNAAVILFTQGRDDDGRQYLERAVELERREVGSIATPTLASTPAYLAWLEGDHEAALGALAPFGGATGNGSWLLSWRPVLAWALVDAGRLEDAEALGRDLLASAAGVGPAAEHLAQHTFGLVAAAQGDAEAAREGFAAALANPAATAVEHGVVELDYGRFLANSGDPEGATWLRRSHARFATLGAVPLAARARQLLGGLAGSATQVAAPKLSPLSPAEEAVARLVQAGASNREVAESLVLSVRTVETHLARVYRKLGVRSRTQMVARLAALRAEVT